MLKCNNKDPLRFLSHRYQIMPSFLRYWLHVLNDNWVLFNLYHMWQNVSNLNSGTICFQMVKKFDTKTNRYLPPLIEMLNVPPAAGRNSDSCFSSLICFSLLCLLLLNINFCLVKIFIRLKPRCTSVEVFTEWCQMMRDCRWDFQSWGACGRNYIWKLMQSLWRTLWRFLKKLGIKLSYVPVLPLLGTFPVKIIIQNTQWKKRQTLFLKTPKSLQMVTTAMKWKNTCFLEEKLWPTQTIY